MCVLVKQHMYTMRSEALITAYRTWTGFHNHFIPMTFNPKYFARKFQKLNV